MTEYEYKCVRIKKNGLCKLIMNVCKKNVVLPREWAGKERELNHVYAALESNGYPSKFIHDLQTKKTRPPPNLSPEELVNLPSHASLSRPFHISKV